MTTSVYNFFSDSATIMKDLYSTEKKFSIWYYSPIATLLSKVKNLKAMELCALITVTLYGSKRVHQRGPSKTFDSHAIMLCLL